MTQRIETGPGWELRCGDCLDPETGLASLDAVDHVITDPPYDAAPYSRAEPGIKRSGRELASLRKMADGAIGSTRARDVAPELARICQRWAIVFFDAESVAAWGNALCDGGLEHVRIGAWAKTNPMPQFSGDRPAQGYEAAEIAHRPGRKRWNGKGAALWHYPTCMGAGRPDHPCPKPLPLMEQIVTDFTDPGELICDPFAGSGTTGVACIRLGRRFIGWEKDPGFFEVAVKRLRATKEQIQIFDASPPGKQENLPGT